MHRVLNDINFVSKILQKINIDLETANLELKNCREKLKVYRRDFENFVNLSSQTATAYNVSPNFEETRQRKVKKHFDELATDHRFNNRKEYFKVNVFNTVLDILIQQIDSRFTGMISVSKIFNFLNPKFLIDSTEIEISDKCDKFQKKYKDIIDTNFTTQFINLYHLMLPELSSHLTITTFCEKVISKFAMIESDISEIFTAFLLFYTIPITSASAERSFSKLKIIKNYLRNKTGQERLRHLAIIAIENNAASTINRTKLIDSFAIAKARKKL